MPIDKAKVDELNAERDKLSKMIDATDVYLASVAAGVEVRVGNYGYGRVWEDAPGSKKRSVWGLVVFRANSPMLLKRASVRERLDGIAVMPKIIEAIQLEVERLIPLTRQASDTLREALDSIGVTELPPPPEPEPLPAVRSSSGARYIRRNKR